MSETPRLGLPFLQAAQAQKHVTVNEGLALLDGLVQLALESITTTIPPVAAVEGTCYGVPNGSVNEWQGREGQIALRSNGGWIFAMPGPGWRAWITDQNVAAVFSAGAWRTGAVAVSPSGATTRHEILEFDHVIPASEDSIVAGAIPADSIVDGITARVISAIDGSLATWRLGVPVSSDRYGSGLGLSLGTWVRGLTASPTAYFDSTDLVLTAEGGEFASGTVRIAIHLTRLGLPSI